YLFFFSSRRRHTRFSRDWSSDVCSSDLQPPTKDVDQVVAHSLFSDAAAAVVVQPGSPRSRSALTVVDVTALTDATTSDHMTWNVTDLGFRMSLSPRVSVALSRHVGPTITGLLGLHG